MNERELNRVCRGIVIAAAVGFVLLVAWLL